MKEIRPRITGTEMEWPVGLRYEYDDGYKQASDTEINYIISHLSKDAVHYDGFMGNGARCYEDCNHLEYATGEEDTFMGTVAAEIAGERLVRGAIKSFVNSRKDLEDGRTLKRVYHNDSVSCGYHVNLCADAETVDQSMQSLYYLGMWAATASMYTGAGCAYVAPDSSIRFATGQKTLRARLGFHSGTTDFHKPLICLRREPHADQRKYTRVQIVGLDPNISPWASWMTLGTASLVLRAIEQGRDTKKSLLLDPHQTSDFLSDNEPIAQLARDVARSPDLDAMTTRANGKLISAVDIQKELYKMCKKTEHTDEEAEVLKNWKKVLDSISGDRKFLHEKAGWAVKRRQLQHFAAKKGLEFDDKKILGFDRSYDENRDGGVAEKLRAKLWSEDTPAEELIADRMENPCPNTRARIRGTEIKKTGAFGLRTIEWDYVDHYEQTRIKLSDPYMSELPG